MHHALIFDSGIGGLSVSAHIRALCPGLALTYVADDAFRPYGQKTEAQLQARLPQLLATLEIMCNPDVIVIACNTASTTALQAIRAAVKAPVVGVVPAIKPAALMSKTGVIAVLGTPGTVARKYVGVLTRKFASQCEVILHGSNGLVGLAEQKFAGQGVKRSDIAAQIAPIFDGPNGGKVDAIVLACTHFPMLAEELAAASPRPVSWIDSGEAIARRVKYLLDTSTPLKPPRDAGNRRPNIAFLMGPDATSRRSAAFGAFGYDRVIGLLPHA